MEAAGLVVDALGRVRDMVHDALKDLSAEELLSPPKPHIAWLVWHLARVQDANFSALMDQPQLWIADRWHARFGMPPEQRKFTPHVTLARLRDASSHQVADYLSARGLFRTPPFQVSRFVLFSSRASIGGGPYVVEASYPLAASFTPA